MKLQEARAYCDWTLCLCHERKIIRSILDQLVQNHFVDKNYIENIWKGQYENMKYDVKVAHIMVKCAPNASAI
jgi:hypothetical protein